MQAALVTEIVMTIFFLIVIMGATDKRAGRVCADPDWSCADLDPSDQYSRHQPLGESCAQHRRRRVRWRWGARSIVVVLGRAHHRRGVGREGVSLHG